MKNLSCFWKKNKKIVGGLLIAVGVIIIGYYVHIVRDYVKTCDGIINNATSIFADDLQVRQELKKLQEKCKGR